MAGFPRHLAALCRKNFIIWYRTWFGSLLEILLPVACMFAVGYFYIFADAVDNSEASYLDLAYAQYPVTEPVGIRWIPSKLHH